MDALDKEIVTALQYDFPLVARPFAALAKRLGIGEAELLDRIRTLKTHGVIRQISAIFDSARIGYTSTLIAFAVPGRRIEEAAAIVSAHGGVSHNYQRTGVFNLWFTLTIPVSLNLRQETEKLARAAGVTRWMLLPSIRTFKIGFRLDLSGRHVEEKPALHIPAKRVRSIRLPKEFIRELQKDLPLTVRPFRGAAVKLGMTEAEVIGRLRRYIAEGVVRRFAAVLRQRNAGFTANVMVAWAAGKKTDRLAACAVSQERISHCYERHAVRGWPYSLYTMIHGRNMRECEAVVRFLERESGVKRYRMLATVREFKKVRVEYFPVIVRRQGDSGCL